MLSRALSLATVMLLIGGFAAAPVRAQNLEAGKSPSQIFAGTCTACHKGARGLLKTVAPGSLPGFLRQHYTTTARWRRCSAPIWSPTGRPIPAISAASPSRAKDAKQEPSGQPTQLDRFGRPIRRAPVAGGLQAGRRRASAAGRAGGGKAATGSPTPTPPSPPVRDRRRPQPPRSVDRMAAGCPPSSASASAASRARSCPRPILPNPTRRWARLQRARRRRTKSQVQPRMKAANLKQSLMRENPNRPSSTPPKARAQNPTCRCGRIRFPPSPRRRNRLRARPNLPSRRPQRAEARAARLRPRPHPMPPPSRRVAGRRQLRRQHPWPHPRRRTAGSPGRTSSATDLPVTC